ncbi:MULTISPECIES: FadR/GntR family transcriptional regulator [Chryseobacterium]|uniref:FadR/GntR family transcriptional regulator n=1 Tax=Chryseobacterium TaxID=59732 RepID=UPI002359E4F3|nr:FadR/GntR family transcriptional regulator [Chryseobacterium sp. B21-037]MDC8106382.1 FadR family transcriptional regulator [Chryseobacterium sp. B21-037]WBV55601.1 FadR/GntR family transcriptional regulator [Chryseobacterium daecheongense]
MTQIQKKTLAQEVAERLTEGILNETYSIGDQLPTEPELMKVYGVGRSSIREAIKILSIKGVLSVQQGVGTFVVSKNVQESLEIQMSNAEIEEVEEVRSLLESKVAAKAALNHTEAQLKTIKEYLDLRNKFAEENMALECYQADINFHLSIAEACGNKLLKEIYKIASRQVLRVFESSHKNNTEAFRISQKLHAELYEYIRNRDADNAALIAEKIIHKLL